jgi:carbon monoxide dehydrogenase subunit G
MLTIDTGYKPVAAQPEQVFTFLSDLNNLQKLMPDRVENWQSDTDSCTFTIKGMAEIGMKIEERIPSHTLKLVSHGKVPFKFNLDILIRPDSSGSNCETAIVFNGDINMFMKMMVETPLTNFFKMLLEKLPSQF